MTSLEDLVRFYKDGLGFAEVGHDLTGYTNTTSVRLRPPRASYQLELTKQDASGRSNSRTTNVALVVRLANEGEWKDAVARMAKSGYVLVPSPHPFCDQHEVTFKDPEGYRVVIAHDAWES